MKTTQKQFSLDVLAPRLEELRAQGKRIVLCHGVFDLLHIGHIRYLRQAREHGDVLVVTLSPDRYVDKGPSRPAFTEQLRAEALASLDTVDFVAINAWPTAEETLRLLHPHVYAKGAEFKDMNDPANKIAREATMAEELGIEMVFIEDVVFSSSNLINRYLSHFSEETQEYLKVFRTQYSIDAVTARVEALSGLRVLLIGDLILDEYLYCSPLGASSKDPVLAVTYQSRDLFNGGAAAVAHHVAQFASEVALLTVVGDDDRLPFVRENLDPRVRLHACMRRNAPTLLKQRIIEGYSFQKLIEVYHMDADPLPEELEEELQATLVKLLPQYDMVIAADFGHGVISLETARFLAEKAPFLAVNTQANAGNRGFHTISRYPRANFVSLARHEINLEYRNQSMSLSLMMTDLRARLGADMVLVTEGRKGCAAIAPQGFRRAPSFASNEVDRVGAGDALFSLASLAAYTATPPELVTFLGNIAGSMAVETIGNAKVIDKASLLKTIRSIMK